MPPLQFLSIGNQYGKGWFLTGEMAERILPGVSNIVAVDYDPGASEVNQLNRIKLMLSAAQKNIAAAADDA